MELNNNAKKTYIQILIDTLEKKFNILDEILQITTRQQNLIDEKNFDEDEFMNTISLKEKLINNLSELDHGFELVYEHVREELKENSDIYKSEITSLKELVRKITDLSISLQALEKRNKTNLEAVLSKKRKEIGKARLSNETVANYYKTMTGLQSSNAYFYDKKN